MIRVIAQYPATADAVDAAPEQLPDDRHFPSWHAWAWACGFVPFVALSGYRVLAPTRDWPTPQWLIEASGVALLVTVVLALVRYRDDRARDTARRDREAIATDSLAAVGTVTGTPLPPGNSRGVGVGVGVGVEFEGPHGPTVAVLPLPNAAGPKAAGSVAAGPVSATADDEPAAAASDAGPHAVAPPRPGDPVAIWAARDRPVVLIRYQRDWADDLLAAVHGEDGDPGPDDAKDPDAAPRAGSDS